MTQLEVTKSRVKQLGAIHILAGRLKLDDDLYRELVWRISADHGRAVRSAGDLNAAQRRAVLDELRRLTGDSQQRMRTRVPPAKDAPHSVREDAQAMIGKIGALLADADRGWAYAHGMARKMFGITRIEWCTSEQLHRIVAALSYDQRRRQTQRKQHGN